MGTGKGAIRGFVCWLTAVTVAVSGCAGSIPPAGRVANTVEAPAGPLIVLPGVVPDGIPIVLVGFDPTREARDASDLETRDRIARHQKGTGVDAATVIGCIVIPIYWIPCIVALPPAIVTASAIDYGRASAKVPSLPSDRKLARVAAEVRERMTAAALAEDTLQISGGASPAGSSGQYPRLLIRTKSAELSRGGGKSGDFFTIKIDVVAQLQPSSGSEWAPTQHSYVVDYEDDHDKLVRDLNYARTALARSIAVAYVPAHARTQERILIQAPVSDIGSNVGCRAGIRTGEHVLERVRKTFPRAALIDSIQDPEKYKVLKVTVVRLRRASKGVTIMKVQGELTQSGYRIAPPFNNARNSSKLSDQESCQVVDALMRAFADDIAQWLAMVLSVAPDAAESRGNGSTQPTSGGLEDALLVKH